MTLHKKTKISTPAEKVWPLVSDPLLMSSWNQLIRTVIPVTLGEPKAGTRYRIRYGLLRGESNYSAELMEFEKHSRCVLHLEGGHLPRKGYIQEIYEIRETTHGCFVSQTMLIDHAGRLFPLSLGIRLTAIMTAVQPFLRVQKHVGEPRNFVATAQCYGDTFQQFSVRFMQEQNIECRWIEDPTNLDAWASRIDANTRFLYGGLPSNPGQGFFDIRAVADLAHAHNLPLIVDSTVASPALLRPICHGADIVVQSATKTLTSSGFGICGAVIARKNLVTSIPNDALKADFSLYIKYLPNRDYGPNLHPMQAIMTLNEKRGHR